MKHSYIIYDGRANYDVDDASVYESCDSLEEARTSVKETFNDGVIYEYEVDGDMLRNGKEVN